MADLKAYEEKMEKTVSVLKEDFNTIRVGRANTQPDSVRGKHFCSRAPYAADSALGEEHDQGDREGDPDL